MQNYTVKKDDQGMILVKDNKECYCPFVQPIITPGSMGGVQIMRLPCSTGCPHANYNEFKTTSADVNEYVITCTGTEQVFDVNVIDNTLKLI